MTKEIVTCDFCGREIGKGDERFAIDARVRHYSRGNPRAGRQSVDMCPSCYAELQRMCKESASRRADGGNGGEP